jgi:poly(beta-D-mannuronate) lyase
MFDEKLWKLTLPVGRKGKPTETRAPFVDIPGILDKVADGYIMTCPVNGVTTPNTKYARCEFRELDSKGGLASWSSSTGVHTMEYSFKVIKYTPKKPHIVIGQVHDSKDDVLEVRFEHPRILVKQSSKLFGVITPSYDGGIVNVKMVFAGDTITITSSYSTSPIVCKVSKRKGCYFKVGNYIQSNTNYDDEKDKSVVHLLSAVVSHT